MKAKYRKLLAEARIIATNGCDPAAIYYFEDDADAAGFRATAILDVALASPAAPKRRGPEDKEEDYDTHGRKRRGHRQFSPDRW